jgi:hypothetical protein
MQQREPDHGGHHELPRRELAHGQGAGLSPQPQKNEQSVQQGTA